MCAGARRRPEELDCRWTHCFVEVEAPAGIGCAPTESQRETPS